MKETHVSVEEPVKTDFEVSALAAGFPLVAEGVKLSIEPGWMSKLGSGLRAGLNLGERPRVRQAGFDINGEALKQGIKIEYADVEIRDKEDRVIKNEDKFCLRVIDLSKEQGEAIRGKYEDKYGKKGAQIALVLQLRGRMKGEADKFHDVVYLVYENEVRWSNRRGLKQAVKKGLSDGLENNEGFYSCKRSNLFKVDEILRQNGVRLGDDEGIESQYQGLFEHREDNYEEALIMIDGREELLSLNTETGLMVLSETIGNQDEQGRVFLENRRQELIAARDLARETGQIVFLEARRITIANGGVSGATADEVEDIIEQTAVDENGRIVTVFKMAEKGQAFTDVEVVKLELQQTLKQEFGLSEKSLGQGMVGREIMVGSVVPVVMGGIHPQAIGRSLDVIMDGVVEEEQVRESVVIWVAGGICPLKPAKDLNVSEAFASEEWIGVEEKILKVPDWEGIDTEVEFDDVDFSDDSGDEPEPVEPMGGRVVREGGKQEVKVDQLSLSSSGESLERVIIGGGRGRGRVVGKPGIHPQVIDGGWEVKERSGNQVVKQSELSDKVVESKEVVAAKTVWQREGGKDSNSQMVVDGLVVQGSERVSEIPFWQMPEWHQVEPPVMSMSAMMDMNFSIPVWPSLETIKNGVELAEGFFSTQNWAFFEWTSDLVSVATALLNIMLGNNLARVRVEVGGDVDRVRAVPMI